MYLSQMNITMHIFCMVLLVVLIVSQTFRKMSDLQNRLFLGLLVIMCFCSAIDLLILLNELYQPGILLMNLLKTAENLLIAVKYPLLFSYLLMDETNEKEPFRKARHVIRLSAVISAAAVILFLLAQNGFFLRPFIPESESGYLFFSRLSILISHVFLSVFALHGSGAWLPNRKMVLGYSAFMSVIALIDIVFVHFDFCFAWSVLTVLSIYLNFQLEAEKRMESMKLELLDSRISLILGKVRPDFVFGVLEKIEKLCLEDTERAQEAISLLSDFLRGNIDRIDTNDTIPFVQELEHVQKYVELIRLSDPSVSLHYALKYKGFFVPIRTVYPLVEEFVEGGIAEKRKKTDILISSERQGDFCIVDVSGPARTEIHDIGSAGSHYETISARLSQFHDSSFRLYCTRGGQLHAVIRYPLMRKGGQS